MSIYRFRNFTHRTMDTKKTKQKITELEKRIQTMEDRDPFYMIKDLKKLRHMVMYIHMRIEASLELLLSYYLMDWKTYKHDVLESAKFLYRFSQIYNKMEFSQKVGLCSKLGLIEDNLRGKIFAVNDYRIYFAHPKAYERDINRLKRSEKRLKVLETLVTAMDSINSLFPTVGK